MDLSRIPPDKIRQNNIRREKEERGRSVNYMTDAEIKDLLGYSNVECEIVRFRRTDDGYLDENNNKLSIQQLFENAHYINGDNGAVIYE